VDDVDSQAHGVLLSILDTGVLLLGPSGIGKSECALDLIVRGHPLIADDRVLMECRDGKLVGRAPEVIRHFLEIRGIGLLYVPDLYGPDAVRVEGSVDLVCRLEEWREGVVFDRIGAQRPRESFAGVSLPVVTLPARPAGSVATLVEASVRDHLQRSRGATGAERIDAAMRVLEAADTGAPSDE
jgi:HPr kinase/phosphorylase